MKIETYLIALSLLFAITITGFYVCKSLVEVKVEPYSEATAYFEKETLKKRVAFRFANAALHDGKYLSQLRAEYYAAIVFYMADIYKVSPNLIMGIIITESVADKDAVSNKGAIGLMQVMPATGRDYHCKNLSDPEGNIECGVKILKDLLAKYHEDAAIKYYLCGESRFHSECVYSKETHTYYKKVKRMSKI